jgi:predicted PolB exonuclease-like 3'-5' exonuclease
LSDEDREITVQNLKDGMGLSPLTAEIVSIAILDLEKNKGAVYYQAPGSEKKEFEENNFVFKPMNEKEILENFWRVAESYDEFITFNGRGFDAPFLAIRSAKQGIKPTRDLLSNRYVNSQKFNAKHVDLLDQLTFYGAVWKNKGSLHMWCRLFGIKSPKADNISGDDVARLFQDGEYDKIAKYNAGDVVATGELYKIWEKFIKM